MAKQKTLLGKAAVYSKSNSILIAVGLSIIGIVAVFGIHASGKPTKSSSTDAVVVLETSGLPSQTKVLFTANSPVGNCGSSITFAAKISCSSAASIGSSTAPITITYPKTVTTKGRTYTAYQQCGGITDATGGGAGACNSIDASTPNTFQIYDDAGDTTWHWGGVNYQ